MSCLRVDYACSHFGVGVVLQGALGDFWLIAAISSVAEYDCEMLKNNFSKVEDYEPGKLQNTVQRAKSLVSSGYISVNCRTGSMTSIMLRTKHPGSCRLAC